MPALDSLFGKIEDRFDGKKVEGVDATIVLDLGGEGGGVWTANITDGELDIAEGSTDDFTAKIMMTAADFLALANGELNPMVAFMSKKIKFEGDISALMQFQSMLS